MIRALLLAATLPALLGFAAQAQTTGCGDPNIKFDVRTTKSGAPAVANAGQALVYFIQDEIDFQSAPSLTTRIALDGHWVGAERGRSYLAVLVALGEHDICSSWQNRSLAVGLRNASAHFTAEPGKTYFFEVRDTFQPTVDAPIGRNRIDVTLVPVDPNEGRLLTASYKQSISHPKN